MSLPDPDFEMLQWLITRAVRKHKLGQEDAEDLAADTWIKLSKKHPGKRVHEIEASARLFLANGRRDKWPTIGRSLMKRVRSVVKEGAGADPIEEWGKKPNAIFGPRSMRGEPALRGAEIVERLSRIDEFLAAPSGLEGANAFGMTTRHVLERFFAWTGRPATQMALVVLVAPIHIQEQLRVDIDIDAEIADRKSILLEAFVELGLTPERVWMEIARLPHPMLASIALKLEADLLEKMRPGVRKTFSQLIEEWWSPPEIDDLEQPVEDEDVARGLKMNRNSLHVTRNRARKVLLARLGLGETC